VLFARAGLASVSEDDWDQATRVNLKGAFFAPSIAWLT
jgi:NAD(P)-dependent dehydrogenase (short-subunit alcohol dehydrogenase family)